MPRAFVVVVVVAALAACSENPTQPRAFTVRPGFASDPEASGPPPARSFGADTYRTEVFTGDGVTSPGLTCDKAANKSRACSGFLASGVDSTRLDVTLQVPQGGGPFPLVVLMHGWAGSKTGSGDVADALVSDGLAVLRYSARGFGESWGQANLADIHRGFAQPRRPARGSAPIPPECRRRCGDRSLLRRRTFVARDAVADVHQSRRHRGAHSHHCADRTVDGPRLFPAA